MFSSFQNKRPIAEQKIRVHELEQQLEREREIHQNEISDLYNCLALCEKNILQIIPSLRSEVKKNSERLPKEVQQKDAMTLKAEKDSEAEGLRMLNEVHMKLRQQREKSQTELRGAKATIEQHRRDWTIPRHEIEISEKELGRGGWGWVKEGKFRGTEVAVKQMNDSIVSPHNRRLFEREMKIAASCRHPNLLQFIGATNDNAVPLLLTERMDIDLRTLLRKRSLKHKEILTLSLDVNLALNYLHLKDPPIVHRDISSANVLLWKQGTEWRAKLSDYGSANLIRESNTANTGAWIYAAPEAMTPTQHSPKVSYYKF